MNTKLDELKEDFIAKQELLEKARVILKQEYFGIDKAIDQLIDNTRSWYVMNELQDRPLIVNLWGLTGVGKTSLIRRMAELLTFESKYYRFDLGNKRNRFSFDRGFDDLCEVNETESLIIVLDEFQQTKTIKGGLFREELMDDDNRRIWDLLDSGKIEYFDWYYELNDFVNYAQKLKLLLNRGVLVESGKVIKGKNLYKLEMGNELLWNDGEDNEEVVEFVNPDHYAKIMEYSGKRLGFELVSDIKQYLLSLNGSETINFLHNVIKDAKKPKIKNFRKALIFIVGNLDEAYQMSNNFSADIDADVFYNSSLKITLPQIKNALMRRFRSEQIARLGNVHIIYPALSKKAYEQIIKKELNRIVSKLDKAVGLNIHFDKSLERFIYDEGVYPTQGARPVLTTIASFIGNHIPVFVADVVIKNITPEALRLYVEGKKLSVEYIQDKVCVHSKSIELNSQLNVLRQSTLDDVQAITAVHESGHAILSIVLMKTLPTHIYSVTTELGASGFVLSKFPWKYISRKEIQNRVAMYLGGMVAEELVFGKEHVTSGASSDIEKVTNFLTYMYKESGMHETPINYEMRIENNHAYHNCESIEEAIKTTIEQGLSLAKKTLEKEMNLLLSVANYLSDNSSIEREVLLEMVNKVMVSEVELIDDGDCLYYRERLKSKTIKKSKTKKAIRLNEMVLNRDDSRS